MNISSPIEITPPLIAERGGSKLAPENTLAAFEKSSRAGIQWIHADVKITHDGIPIIYHDNTLDRTTDGHGLVADTLWKDMETLDAGSSYDQSFRNERIPQLKDLVRFTLTHKLHLNLNIQPCPGRTQATTMVTLIETSQDWPSYVDPPLISSFDEEALLIASRLRPDWPRLMLFEQWTDDVTRIINKVGASSVGLNHKEVSHDHLRQLKEMAVPLYAFTVDDPFRCRELKEWGVSAVFSTNPLQILKIL